MVRRIPAKSAVRLMLPIN